MIEFEALGTHWCVELLGGETDRSLKSTVLRYATNFGRNYTRFSDTSLLGQLNLRKRLVDPPSELLAMLSYARDMWQASEGVFNISVGGTLQKLGYGKAGGRGTLAHSFWDDVKLTPRTITIPGEITLDFGGFGKGWLIDALGALLEQNSASHYIVNGGGDLLVSAPAPLEFALEHPYDSSRAIGTTRIQRGALAVSSAAKRHWVKDGQRHHHIIDPRTGQSSQSGVVSTYVRADTALIADTCATILLIAPELDTSLTSQFHLNTILLNSSNINS